MPKEYAAFGQRRDPGAGHTGPEALVAIQRTIATLEKRRPGSTAHVKFWGTRRLPDGSLLGVPYQEARRGTLTVAEALRRTRARASNTGIPVIRRRS